MKLVKPSMEYDAQIQSYRQEFLKRKETLHGASGLARFTDTRKWLEELELYSRKESVPEGKVPALEYLFIREEDNRLVGLINIRLCLNEALLLTGGHIGYSIHPDERQKGYGKKMLRMGLEECHRRGMDKVLVTCNRNNEASRRTILANGGVYENTVFDASDGEYVERYWIDTKREKL